MALVPFRPKKKRGPIRQYLGPFSCVFQRGAYLETASLSDLPALKAGTLVAGMLIEAPVAGFTPLRAARSRTSKVPNPTRVTFCPLASASSMDDNTASTL